MVEAAFVTPVFLALLLGLMEIGLYMNDYLAVANTVRGGARAASVAGNDMYADYYILQAIKEESAAIPRQQIQDIVVYKATAFGTDPNANCLAGTAVAGQCNVYHAGDLDKAESHFGCIVSENLDYYWCPTTRSVLGSGAGPDYVGVYIHITHPWITKMFGSGQDITDESVIRLEPQQF